MSNSKPSRAFDPTYKPTKTFKDLAAEFPKDPGIKMLADREQVLKAASPNNGLEEAADALP